MAKQKKTELKQKTKDELRMQLYELRDSLMKLRLDHAKMQVKKTSDMKNTRLQIARILTAMKEKEEKNG
jgi:ribosomal protein L29